MSGPPPTRRTLAMVEAVKAGGTMKEVGWQFGVTKQRVSQAYKRHAFPSVGPPGHELYMVGQCRKCGVALSSYTPVARDICGHCS